MMDCVFLDSSLGFLNSVQFSYWSLLTICKREIAALSSGGGASPLSAQALGGGMDGSLLQTHRLVGVPAVRLQPPEPTRFPGGLSSSTQLSGF